MVNMAKMKVIGGSDKVRTAMRAPGSLKEESCRRTSNLIKGMYALPCVAVV